MSMSHGQPHFTIKMDTTAPTNADTTTIFDSTVAFHGVGRMRHQPIERLTFGVFHDQTFTLLGQRSLDGSTWDTYFSQAYTAPAANTITGPVDFLIDTEHEFRLRITNGGVTQTTWRPAMKGIEKREPGI